MSIRSGKWSSSIGKSPFYPVPRDGWQSTCFESIEKELSYANVTLAFIIAFECLITFRERQLFLEDYLAVELSVNTKLRRRFSKLGYQISESYTPGIGFCGRLLFLMRARIRSELGCFLIQKSDKAIKLVEPVRSNDPKVLLDDIFKRREVEPASASQPVVWMAKDVHRCITLERNYNYTPDRGTIWWGLSYIRSAVERLKVPAEELVQYAVELDRIWSFSDLGGTMGTSLMQDSRDRARAFERRMSRIESSKNRLN
jgi:hypothetical protein